jgi:hypothetical protein
MPPFPFTYTCQGLSPPHTQGSSAADTVHGACSAPSPVAMLSGSQLNASRSATLTTIAPGFEQLGQSTATQ